MRSLISPRAQISLLLAALLWCAAGANADPTGDSGAAVPRHDTTFISFNGKFVFSFPSRWALVDYKTVDYFQQQVGSELEYEGVFAPPENAPFFKADYLVVQIDTLRGMTPALIDTVLAEAGRELHQKILRQPSATDLGTDVTLTQAVYDAQEQTLWNLSEQVGNDNARKRILMAERYYGRGMARFLFYAPETTYAALLPQFRQVLHSFSDERYEAKIPKSEVVVADSTTFRQKTSDNTKLYVIALAAAVAILAALLLSRRKK